jgi:hypothetical protein
MVATMNPFMTTRRGFIIKQSARSEFATQFFACEQTDRINGRPITFDAPGHSTEATPSHRRLPGGRHICLAHEDRQPIRLRLPSFAPSFSIVPTTHRISAEVERQKESP